MSHSKIAILVGLLAGLFLVAPVMVQAESKQGNDAPAQGAESPRAVFDRLVTAETENDYATVYRCMLPARRTRVLAQRVQIANSMTDGDEEAVAALGRLLDRYDVTLPEPNEDGTTPLDRYVAAVQGVEDKGSLYVTLSTWIARAAGDEAGGPQGTWSLTGLERDGNVARGTVTITLENGEEQQFPIVFRRHNERWFLDPFA